MKDCSEVRELYAIHRTEVLLMDIRMREFIGKDGAKEISREMHLSEGTVINYMNLIIEKLQLIDRTPAANFFYYTHNRI